MRLYGSIEEVVPMCLVKKNMASPYASHSAPPPPPQKKKKNRKKNSKIWILCQNSLTRELRIRFIGLVLKKLFTHDVSAITVGCINY